MTVAEENERVRVSIVERATQINQDLKKKKKSKRLLFFFFFLRVCVCVYVCLCKQWL